jgi:hypothetical protein
MNPYCQVSKLIQEAGSLAATRCGQWNLRARDLTGCCLAWTLICHGVSFTLKVGPVALFDHDRDCSHLTQYLGNLNLTYLEIPWSL